MWRYLLSCLLGAGIAMPAQASTMGDDPVVSGASLFQMEFNSGAFDFVGDASPSADITSQSPLWGKPLIVGGRIGGAITGATAAALTHELGHAMMAWAHGYSFTWPTGQKRPELFLPYWRIRSDDEITAAGRRNVAASGFLLSGLTSELLLSSDFFPKGDVFVGGFLFYDMLNSAVYIARDLYEYSRYGRGIGDIRDMQAGGFPRELTYLILLVKSAVMLARILDNPDFSKLSFWWDLTPP